MVTIGSVLKKVEKYRTLNKKRDYNWVGDSIDGKGIYIDNSTYTREDLINKHVVYFFEVNGYYYVGTTNNIVRRLHEHFTRRDGRVYRFIGKENCIYVTILDIFNNQAEARKYEKETISALQYYPKYKLINCHV